MLSLHTIERAHETADHDRLVREVAANGLSLPLPLRVRLASSEAAAVALGLRRVAELTYGPTALSRAMIARLLELQRADGGFGAEPGDDPRSPVDVLATGCVAAALCRVLSEHRLYAGDPLLTDARDRALGALASTQAGDGLFIDAQDRDFADRVLVAAFLLTLLGDEPAFRAAVRWADLMTWFDEHADRLPASARRFWELARAEADARREAERLLTPAA